MIVVSAVAQLEFSILKHFMGLFVSLSLQSQLQRLLSPHVG